MVKYIFNATIIQNQMVKSGVVISPGYLSNRNCYQVLLWIKFHKTGESISYLKELYCPKKATLISDFLPLHEFLTNYRYDLNITCFWRFQKCWSIAESTTLTIRIVNLDNTSFFGLSKFQLCWILQDLELLKKLRLSSRS